MRKHVGKEKEILGEEGGELFLKEVNKMTTVLCKQKNSVKSFLKHFSYERFPSSTAYNGFHHSKAKMFAGYQTVLFTLNPELKIRPTQRTLNPVFENLTLKCLHQRYAFEMFKAHVQIRGAQEDTNNLQLLVLHFFF